MTAREIPREVDLREFSGGEIRAVTRTVFVDSDPQPSDLMFIFGASRSSGSWNEAAALLRAGMASRVLVTGGAPYDEGFSMCEAQGIRSELTQLGVAADIVLTEERSRNTLENVIFSREVLQRSAAMPNSILFYCKSHHAGRAWRTLAKHMPGVSLSCATYDAIYGHVAVSPVDWHKTDLAARRVLAEYERIIFYSARGDIA